MFKFKVSILVLISLVMLPHCFNSSLKDSEREITFYVKSQESRRDVKKTTEKKRVRKEKKLDEAATKKEVSDKDKFKKMFENVTDKMEKIGILAGDLGEYKEDFSFLKLAVENEKWNSFLERIQYFENSSSSISTTHFRLIQCFISCIIKNNFVTI